MACNIVAISGGSGIALEEHRLTLVTRSAVEPIYGDTFRGGFEQQAIVISLPLPRFLAQIDLRPVTRNINDLIDGQMMAIQRDGLVGHRRAGAHWIGHSPAPRRQSVRAATAP